LYNTAGDSDSINFLQSNSDEGFDLVTIQSLVDKFVKELEKIPERNAAMRLGHGC
jgi:hypothetical protein